MAIKVQKYETKHMKSACEFEAGLVDKFSDERFFLESFGAVHFDEKYHVIQMEYFAHTAFKVRNMLLSALPSMYVDVDLDLDSEIQLS